MEINEFHHPDSIWTWRPNPRRRKVSLWLPYFQGVAKLPKGKGDRYTFSYKGGELECHLKDLDFLMFYGASGDISLAFLDKLNEYKIPLMIHRRNMDRPYVFHPESGNDDADILTAQIEARENQIKRCYIARTIIAERFRNMDPLVPFGPTTRKMLLEARSVTAIRAIEATRSRRYWVAWYSLAGIPDGTRRSKDFPLNQALDAGSFFLFGILLRWVLFHKLSPSHGYLHEPTGYPSLIYDLMEPYRYLIEDAALEAQQIPLEQGVDLTAATISNMKKYMEDWIYVPATRQKVRQKNLLHGIVLALRSYLLGETRRLVVPVKGNKKGGRPLKLAYRLPGS